MLNLIHTIVCSVLFFHSFSHFVSIYAICITCRSHIPLSIPRENEEKNRCKQSHFGAQVMHHRTLPSLVLCACSLARARATPECETNNNCFQSAPNSLSLSLSLLCIIFTGCHSLSLASLSKSCKHYCYSNQSNSIASRYRKHSSIYTSCTVEFRRFGKQSVVTQQLVREGWITIKLLFSIR